MSQSPRETFQAPLPAEALRDLALAALDKLKAQDVVTIDVREKTSITDYLVIASGTSTRHVKALSDELIRQLKDNGQAPLGVEGEREAEWVLVDCGDLVVHLMLPRVREFYGLERLWASDFELPPGRAEALARSDVAAALR